MPYFPVTPQPKPEESIFSWAIRLAEGNIVPSPWHIFRHLGFSQGEMKTPRLDVSRLWHLISDDPTALDALAYTNGPSYAFRGQPITVRDLTVGSPKLCPECVAENGFAHAHWDLELVTCCHLHDRRLVQTCPHCGKKITWFRASLQQCSCGASFIDAAVDQVSSAEKNLNKVIYQVAFRKSPNGLMSNPALVALNKVPLQFLLRFIALIGTLHTQGRLVSGKQNRTPARDLVTAAAEVLDGWPGSFHGFLSDLTQRPPRAGQERFGVLGFIDDFQAAMLDHAQDRKHCELFRSEIRTFLASTWDGPIDSRIVLDLMRHGLTPRWVSLAMASQILDVDKRTLNLIMNRGLIHFKVEGASTSRRILLRSEDIKPEWFAPTPLLNDRSAAERLGIPVSVLRALRQSGEYVQTYFGANSVSFALRDVDALRKLVASGKHYVQGDPEHGIPLGKVMRLKFRNAKAKTDIVRSIIAGGVRTVANNPETLATLVVHPSDLKIVLEQITRPLEGAISAKQAGAAIHTTLEVVGHLVASGHLAQADNGLIEAQSVRQFIEGYICLNTLLFHRKDKIAFAETVCAREEIELVVAPSKRGSCRRFVRKADLPALEELVMERPTKSSRWSAHKLLIQQTVTAT